MKKRFHIIIDSCDIKGDLLYDQDLILKIVRKLVKLCDMNILYGPILINGVPENPGITCFCIIDFSHISLHTFTDTNEICIDVFSCKKFDYNKVKKYLMKTFNMDKKETYYKEVLYDNE